MQNGYGPDSGVQSFVQEKHENKKKKKIEKRNYSPDRSFKIAELTAMKLCNENVPCHGVDFPEEDLFELESEG